MDGKNESLSFRGTPSPTSAPELSFGIHQPGLNPSAEGPVVANGLAIEQLCQCPLDSLIDVAKLGLLDGHFGNLGQTRDPLDTGDRGAAEGVAGHDVRRGHGRVGGRTDWGEIGRLRRGPELVEVLAEGLVLLVQEVVLLEDEVAVVVVVVMVVVAHVGHGRRRKLKHHGV